MPHRYDDSEAVVETRVVHDTHRRATSLLADAVDASAGTPRRADIHGGADAPGRADAAHSDAVDALHALVVPMLRHHHESEDRDLWPTLVAAAPSLAGRLDELSREHDRLDGALDRLAVAATPVSAREVRDLLHDHLDHEEPILFPALNEHVTEAEWAAFSARTVATFPQVGTDLMVALFYEVAPEEDVAVLLRHLPPEAQAMVPAMRTAGDRTLAALAARVGAGSRSPAR